MQLQAESRVPCLSRHIGQAFIFCLCLGKLLAQRCILLSYYNFVPDWSCINSVIAAPVIATAVSPSLNRLFAIVLMLPFSQVFRIPETSKPSRLLCRNDSV